MLRHDVEDRYENALYFAKIEHNLNIKGTYYFRFAQHSFNSSVIHAIAEMGHEIGYHYDDLTACKGDYKAAIKRFENNLNLLNKIVPIKTICMEGEPLSRYNNLDLWGKYNYREYGITSEPYLDVDFNKVYYLTETGRRWDGHKYNMRDKVTGKNGFKREVDLLAKPLSTITDLHIHECYNSTFDMIEAIKKGNFPVKVMMTFHPQRWNDNVYDWSKELISQNIKNQIKYLLIKIRKRD